MFILQRSIGWTNTGVFLSNMKMVFHSMKATCLSNLLLLIVEPLPACQALFLTENFREDIYFAIH